MNLVTGATGLLGSHIVEQLRKRDLPVRVLVRKGSEIGWLKTQGVEFAEGDITDRASVERACQGCDFVYHSAAKVGDWGPWEDFQRVTIDGTANTIDAAIKAKVRRFVHVSSVSTYGYHTDPVEVNETYELGFGLYKWAYYSRSKIEAERIVWDRHKKGLIELTVIRPAWIYGERDRTTIARLYRMVRDGKAKILGEGTNRLNVIYAGSIADCAITAALRADCNGEIFNASNDGAITQQEYFDLIARTIKAPPVTKKVPYKLAYRAGFVLEFIGHMTNSKKPPFITRYAVWLMGRRSYFSCEKARQKLGWKPLVSYEAGVPRTIQWYLDDCQQRGVAP